MRMGHGFLIHGDEDSVGVAVRDLHAGEKVVGVYQMTLLSVEVPLLNDVPLGHKVALNDIPAGTRIIKYNEVIGIATLDIRRGSHVHVHNIKSVRWA